MSCQPAAAFISSLVCCISPLLSMRTEYVTTGQRGFYRWSNVQLKFTVPMSRLSKQHILLILLLVVCSFNWAIDIDICRTHIIRHYELITTDWRSLHVWKIYEQQKKRISKTPGTTGPSTIELLCHRWTYKNIDPRSDVIQCSPNDAATK